MNGTVQIYIIVCLVLFTGLVLYCIADAFFKHRMRANRILGAAGKRRVQTSGVDKAQLQDHSMMNEGMINFMRNSTKGLSIMKDRQILDVKKMLISGGFRSRDAIVIFTFFKLVSPLVTGVGAALYIYGFGSIGYGATVDIAAAVAAALLGSRMPDIFVKNAQTKRLDAIGKALPDALDMLVICAEAGLSADAALKRVVAEMRRSHSVLAEELEFTALEMNLQPERRIAVENLVERVPLPAINAFANSMIQAEKFGTPLARAFKVLSEEQRNDRMMRAEEKAGRLPALMTMPMMMFILPALFVILVGPAVLSVMDNFLTQ